MRSGKLVFLFAVRRIVGFGRIFFDCGVPDADAEDEADDDEGKEAERPDFPVSGIGGESLTISRGIRQQVTQHEALSATSEVDESIDEARRDTGIFTSTEVHGGSSGEHAVDADDAEAHPCEGEAEGRRTECK